MNIELAEKVRSLIRKYPERHDQGDWATDEELNPVNDCGTRACIAGWVAAANGYTVKDLEDIDTDVFTYAMQQLGIGDSEAGRLFYNFSNESALRVFDEMIANAKEARRAQA